MELLNVLDIIMAVAGPLLGALMAIFLLGMFTPRANTQGALIGLAAGAASLMLVATATDIPKWWYGRFKFVIAEGRSVHGPIPPTGNTNTRGFFEPDVRTFLKRWVADVCYYYGDQGYNFVPPKHVDPSLRSGRDYDVANAEVVLDRMSMRDGRITLPDGMQYELLVLPDREDIDIAVLRKLEKLLGAGATVVGPKPIRCSGLTDRMVRLSKSPQIRHLRRGHCPVRGRSIFRTDGEPRPE